MNNEANQSNLNHEEKTVLKSLERDSKKVDSDNNYIESISDAINIAKHCVDGNNWGGPHYAGFGVWFRGEKDKSNRTEQKNLTPSIFREKNIVEMSIFRHFQTKFPIYKNEYKSVFEWLCFMQHYGTPTRLLDWTENILFAIFFALDREEDYWKKESSSNDHDGNSDQKQDRLVFALNSWLLNDYSNTKYLQEPAYRNLGKRVQTPFNFNTTLRANMAISQSLLNLLSSEEVNRSKYDVEFPPNELWEELCNRYQNTIYEPTRYPNRKCLDTALDDEIKAFFEQMRKPVAVFPYRDNPRLHIQQGTFTIHGGKNEDKYVSNDYQIGNPFQFQDFEYDDLRKFLKVYRIRGNKVDNLKYELNSLGINKGLLFPELDQQSEYLKYLWNIEYEK